MWLGGKISGREVDYFLKPLAAESAVTPITTPYATEVQSMTADARTALGEAQSGATLYRVLVQPEMERSYR